MSEQPLTGLITARAALKKVFHCFYKITFLRKNAQLFVMAMIKREILTSRKVLYTKSCTRNQFLFCKKDAFQNTDFSHPIHTMLFFSKLVGHKSRSAKMSVFFSPFPDVNECKNNVHNRDGNPFCSNSAGSYNCTCSPGYTGNGTSCIGIIYRFGPG